MNVAGIPLSLVVAFVAYMVFVLAIGIYAGKFTRSMESFFLGDRKMGTVVTSISSVASSESGWLIMGFVGEAYILGLSAIWVAVGCLLGFVFNWFFFAEKLRKHSRQRGALTIPDFLEFSTGDKSHVVRYIAVAIILLLMFTYVAAQLTAAGKAFRGTFNMDYRIGVLIGAVVTIFYTTVGGFRAVSWTDVVQGFLMLIALVAIPIMLIVRLGGVQPMFTQLRNEEPKTVYVFSGQIEGRWRTVRIDNELSFSFDYRDNPFSLRVNENDECLLTQDGAVTDVSVNDDPVGEQERVIKKGDVISAEGVRISLGKVLKLEGGKNLVTAFGGRSGLALVGFLIGMLGIGLGYPGAPHVITRYMAAKGESEIRKGRVIALGWGVFAMFGAVFTGLACRCLFRGIGDPDTGLLVAGKLLLHPVLAGLILAAVFSAIRSTADSQLLVASSSVVRDIYQKGVGRQISDRKLMLISRIAVLVLGLAAIILALTEARAIFWFVLFSWAGLGASFGPVLILSLYWKKLTRWGAVAGMTAGFSVTLIWKLLIRPALNQTCGLDVYELVPAFFLASIAAIVVSLGTRSKNQDSLRDAD
jgi:sodium/proline symporter